MLVGNIKTFIVKSDDPVTLHFNDKILPRFYTIYYFYLYQSLALDGWFIYTKARKIEADIDLFVHHNQSGLHFSKVAFSNSTTLTPVSFAPVLINHCQWYVNQSFIMTETMTSCRSKAMDWQYVL